MRTPAPQNTITSWLIGETLEKSKKFARDDTMAKSIGDLFMEIVMLDDQPSTVVEDQCCSLFTTPNNRYFSLTPSMMQL